MAFVTPRIEEDDFCKATGRWPAEAGIADLYELARVIDDGQAGTLLDKGRRLVEALNQREQLLSERTGIFGVWDRRDPDAPIHFVDAACEDSARLLALPILGPAADVVVERMTVAALFAIVRPKGDSE